MDFKWVADHFQSAQAVILFIVLFFGWRTWQSNQEQSKFKRREADRSDLNRIKVGPDLASAKLKHTPLKAESPKSPPLSLPGIRLHGAPHEILGIDEFASEAEIMKAYKEAIKRYHPDVIQGDAQSQMKFYQEASAQLNQAKDIMLSKIRGR